MFKMKRIKRTIIIGLGLICLTSSLNADECYDKVLEADVYVENIRSAFDREHSQEEIKYNYSQYKSKISEASKVCPKEDSVRMLLAAEMLGDILIDYGYLE